jgi:lauroyl/myristoyl acyltransferase
MIKPLSMILGSFVMRLIPRPVSVLIARAVGPLLKTILKNRTRLIRNNLRYLGCLDEKSVSLFYAQLTLIYFDFLRFPFMSPKKIRTLIQGEGEEILKLQIEKGAALLVTPHLGNWEMGGAYFALHDYPVSAVAESLGMDKTLFPGFTATVFRKYREKTGLSQIPLENPMLLVRAIRDRNLILLLGDRDVPGTGAEFDFLGCRRKIPLGPATLCLKTGTPIFTGYMVIEDQKYHGFVEGPVPFEDLEYSDEGIRILTSRVLKFLEEYIRKYPTQWFVFEELKPGLDPKAGRLTG